MNIVPASQRIVSIIIIGIMAGGKNDLRLFVALYPPPEIVAELLEWVGAFDLPPYRLTPADQVHLTLQFIGDVSPGRMNETIESVARSTAGLESFSMQLIRLIRLPERGHARLIAAEADSPPSLMEMQRRLAHRLARNPREKSGDRFLPHFTLARFRSPTRFDIADEDAALDVPPFTVNTICLMSSTLSPAGARHDVVQEFTLP